MAMCAQAMMARGELPGNLLVATAASNMALEIFMREHGGTLLRTKVGDRWRHGPCAAGAPCWAAANSPAI